MEKLYEKLKNYSLEDALNFEEYDRQFNALKNLWEKWSKVSNYLSLIIANSIVCYQLSWKWEDYWEEICKNVVEYDHADWIAWILDFFWQFLPDSKNNKRFVNIKMKRIEKIMPFLKDFVWKEEYYYENMLELRDELAKVMKQRKDAKTIVFAVKMFGYWARNCFNKTIKYPEEITVPVDSRLTKIFEKYKWEYTDINKFYKNLSVRLWIPELHLDAILWNSTDLI